MNYKQRDVYFDNAKFFLIMFVVIGHVIEPLIGQSVSLKTLYVIFYSFHMPCFALISGYFSKKGIGSSKSLKKLLIPYAVFQTLYILFDKLILGNEKARISFTTPYWIMWFLLALILWNIVLPYIKELKYPLISMICIAILVGYDVGVGYYLSLSRAIVFFPFFLLGYYSEKKHFEKLYTSNTKYITLLLMLIISIVVYFNINIINPSWLYGSNPYIAFEQDNLLGALYRSAIYLASATFICGFLQFVPRNTLYISKLGANTLPVYLLHGFIVRLFIKFNLYQFVGTKISKIGIVFLGISLTFILSLDVFSTLIRYMTSFPKAKTKRIRIKLNN